MKATIKHHGEIAIVHIQGPLDIEKTQPFRDACTKHFFGSKVIFNFEQASFVGSTGIQPFVEAIRIVSAKSDTSLKLVGLKTEFRRIFSNVEIQGVEIFDTESIAIESFSRPIPLSAVVLPDIEPSGEELEQELAENPTVLGSAIILE
jgi:anti-anti-sigma factor